MNVYMFVNPLQDTICRAHSTSYYKDRLRPHMCLILRLFSLSGGVSVLSVRHRNAFEIGVKTINEV